MADGSAYLDDIHEKLQSGRRQWKRGDKILEAFGYSRRRQSAIDLIRQELSTRGMVTIPELTTSMPLDRAIRFKLVDQVIDDSDDDVEDEEPGTVTEVVAIADPQPEVHPNPPDGLVVPPATIRIAADAPAADPDEPGGRTLVVGNLECAERPPECIAPSASIEEALTKMDLRDFSQLVVQTGVRETRGVISYKSIARAFLHSRPVTVADCLDRSAPRVEWNEPLLRVVDRFSEHDAVLIMAADKTLSGIVTPADIALEFGVMAGPFLIIGQIEEQLRWLARNLDLKAALAAVSIDGPATTDVSMDDLTMGELERILENPENWALVGIRYDRGTFCKELKAIRELRNAVMHFRDFPYASAFKRMKDFAALVQRAYLALQTQGRQGSSGMTSGTTAGTTDVGRPGWAKSWNSHAGGSGAR